MPQVAGRRVGPRETARIRAYLEDTQNPLTAAAIADIMGLSRRTIERIRLNFELFDAPYPPTTMKLGRPPNLTEEQQGFVLQFFTEKPYAKLEDATAAVWERYDVNLSAKGVSNILFKHKWTRTGFKGKDRKAPGAARRPPAPPTTDEVVAEQSSASGLVRSPTADGDVQWSPAQEAVVAEAQEPPLQPRVELPEISIPAFFLDATGPPMNASRPAAPAVRVPCPTCGCSSREHQNVR